MTEQLKCIYNLPTIFLSILFAIQISGCKKLVVTDPPSDRLTGTTVFQSDATAIAVFNYIYANMNSQNLFQGAQGLSTFTGIGSDELIPLTLNNYYHRYYHNDLAAVNSAVSNAAGGEQWPLLYNLIYRCNEAIDGIMKSTKMTTSVKKQLLGEAKFLRAFYYFYLINFFGDVPLILDIDPEVNSLYARTSKTKVYEQIIIDLKEAEELLAADFPDITLLKITTERVRPTKWAASGLLARVYLYTDQWQKAEETASFVIANTILFGPLPPLNAVFNKNSREAIWQLQPTALNLNTIEGNTYVIPSTGPSSNNCVVLNTILRNSFEINDSRAVLGNWISKVVYNVSGGTDSVFFPYKYKKDGVASNGVTTAGGMTEYFMVLRLGEQYLIRAEARAHLDKIAEAQQDLNLIRNRAGLGNTTANDMASLLIAILEERRHELFCEMGHRWFDLKRTGKIDEVMNIVTPIKSAGTTNWEPYQALYPIPYLELQRAPNLVQNTGY